MATAWQAPGRPALTDPVDPSARLKAVRTLIVLRSAALLLLLALSGLAALATWDAVERRHAPRTTSAAGLDLTVSDFDVQVANMLLANRDAGNARPIGVPRRLWPWLGTARLLSGRAATRLTYSGSVTAGPGARWFHRFLPMPRG